MARSFACLGDVTQAGQHLLAARGVTIIDADDRALFEKDLTEVLLN
jgi:hypothetical protein